MEIVERIIIGVIGIAIAGAALLFEAFVLTAGILLAFQLFKLF